MKSRIIDCITFFDNNFIFELRYNTLKNYVDFFLICESKFDHRNRPKKINFKFRKEYNKKQIKHILMNKPFPKKNNAWENQALQREYILKYLNEFNSDDYIFFSDPDEIPNPSVLKNFSLKKKYGIFFQKCYNYKFNLFNKFESPWEGSRVCKKKNLKSIDFMRQKIKSKNLNYNFYRLDKEKSIQTFKNSGWHFNNILSPKEIAKKLKSFAHTEFSSKEFSNYKIIERNIINKKDLFKRGHTYKKVDLDETFPEYLIKNKKRYKKFIL